MKAASSCPDRGSARRKGGASGYAFLVAPEGRGMVRELIGGHDKGALFRTPNCSAGDGPSRLDGALLLFSGSGLPG